MKGLIIIPNKLCSVNSVITILLINLAELLSVKDNNFTLVGE